MTPHPSPTQPQGPAPTLYDPEPDELADLLGDQPAYRTRQLWSGLYGNLLEPHLITNLPTDLRQRVTVTLPAALNQVTESVSGTSPDDSTVKFLWELHDGSRIETVLMHYADRTTVCVSTQAGCAMACGFCATGQAGFDRHLTVGEIVEQVVRAARRAAPRRVSNVVFMGMGEPLANYDATWSTVERLHDAMGIGARKLTISTVGLVPGIRRLAEAPLPVNLAISLHAARDELRDQLVPINRRYPLDALAEAATEYFEATRRRISLEWAMIDGVNDTPADARQLAAYARRLAAHVNLIPLNPTPGWPTVGSPPDRVRRFRQALEDAGVNATIRSNRGTEIDAACGQLRAGAATATPVTSPRRRTR